MTYYELWLDAVERLDHNEITLDEYDKLIMPLHREVDTLDKIIAEIVKFPSGYTGLDKQEVLEIIGKYKESEEQA